MFTKIFGGNFFTGIYFSLEILIENHNTNYNFPLFWFSILVEIFLLLQNHILKDSNLGKIFIKSFDGNFFTGIYFSLEILIENLNTNYNFPLSWLVIVVKILLLLQNHFLKEKFLMEIFLLEYICL